jgi:hypothetical protein
MEAGILGTSASGGWINGPYMTGVLGDNIDHIRHDGDEAPFNAVWDGVIQVAKNSGETVLRNSTGGATVDNPTIMGQVYDIDTSDNQKLFAGPNCYADLTHAPTANDDLVDASDGSSNQMAIVRFGADNADSIEYLDLEESNKYSINTYPGGFIFRMNGTECYRMADGLTIFNGAIQIRDTKSNGASNLGWGELAYDDDRGGTGNPAILYRVPQTNTVRYIDFDGTV